MTTTHPERTSATAAVEGDLDVIGQSLDHIKRVTADAAMRAHNAAQAGATLAYAVENFLRGSDPCDDCTDALREAWRVFMARHSGGFTDSVMTVADALALRDAAYQTGHLDGAEEVRQVARNALGLTE